MIVVGVCAAAIVLFLIFWETTWSMVSTWQYSSYSHGYLVLPLSLYLIYLQRKRLVSVRVAPKPWALVLLSGLGFAWFLGDLAAVQFVKQASVVAMIPALVWLTLGTQVTRAFLFPLLYLFFAVPMGQVLVPWLQDFTAAFAVKGLDLVGVPVLLQRRLIFVPSGVWEVAEACSGLRFLTASLALGCFYAYVVYRSWRRRLVFVVASVVVPILANGTRVFSIILLGYFTHNRLAAGVDHLIYGWIFFGMVIFILFAAGWPWHEVQTGQPAGSHPASPFPDVTSMQRRRELTTGNSSVWSGVLLAAVGIVLVAAAPISARLTNEGTGNGSVELCAPAVLPPWRLYRSDIGDWKPRFIEAAGELKQTYMSGKQPVCLYVAYYGGGRSGRKLVSSSNAISRDPSWVDGGTRTRAAVVDGRTISVLETDLRSQAGNLIVWSWYWVDGKFTDNPYQAKFLRVKARLFGGPPASAFLAIGASYASDRADAPSTLQDFLRHTSLRQALDPISK